MAGNIIDKNLIELLSDQEVLVFKTVKSKLPEDTSPIETAFVYWKVTDRIAE